MSMQESFASILSKPSNEVERPKPLPIGTYTCVVHGLPSYDKSSKKQTPYVEFNLNIIAAGDDVDQEALAEMGGIEGKSLRATYYLTDTALWRLKEFLEHCNLDVEGGATLQALIDQTAGCQVLATVKHESSEDGKSVFSKLGGTAAVE